MNILFVHTIGKRKYGGGERWVINAAAGLKKSGHEVFVLSKPNSVLIEKAKAANLNTVSFNIASNISVFHAFILSRIIRKNKIDVVISKGRDLAIAGLASKWGGNPLVIRRSGSPPRKKILKHVYLTKWLADRVITNTETIRNFYIKQGFTEKNFVKVIYNGLVVDDSIPAYDFSTRYPGKTIVLSVGRLVAEKGYFFLIDALALIKNKQPDVLFFIIGSGKDKNRLISYAQKKGVDHMIIFAGYIDQPIPYYKGCDLFLHSSLFEGMPNVVLEAMAYGKPVIMTNVNGAKDLSRKGQYARLIPAADHYAIAESLVHAIQNKDEMINMGRSAQQFARDNFSMNSMINNLESFVKQGVEQKKLQIINKT